MKITTNTSLRRKLAALFCIPSAAAMAAASGMAVVLVNGPMAQPAYAEAVTECLDLVDGSLVNNCPFTIEATWCTENVDCNNGRYTNTWTIGANRSYPVNGGRSGNYVHWGACRGANTLSTHGTAAYSWEFYCE
ncbi:MAG: hypothetical protein AB7Q23_07515 [Hyphomonadaceae bacterium]